MLRKLPVIILLCMAMVLMMASVAFARDINNDIVHAKNSIMTLRQMAQNGVITSAEADNGIQYYLDQAAKAAGKPLTLAEVMATPDPVAQQLTPLQQFAGFISFVNVLCVLAIIVAVGTFAWLFGSFTMDLLRLLKNIPRSVYEMIFYAASSSLLAWGWTMGEPAHGYVGFAGCLLFGAALAFSTFVRERSPLNISMFSLILFVVWAIAAICYGSSLIGFLAIAALLSALGFSIIVTPLCYGIGFKDEAAVGKTTSAAFVILVLFIGLRLLGKSLPLLTVFEFGALFMGSFVGYLGLLIASSRWYHRRSNYVLFQVVTVIAGLAALFVGSVFHIEELLKIGGTFFILYGIEKMMEIPVKSRRGYAAIGLVVALTVIGFCLFVFAHQALLRPFLFLA